MLLNQTTALLTPRLLLRPYRKSAVEQYHAWMSDAAVREATASELLSLEEEYAMQASWRTDDDKLTFIIYLRDLSLDPTSSSFFAAHDASRMIGDVNLFLTPRTPPSSPKLSTGRAAARETSSFRAEIEIMFPLPHSSHLGYATESLYSFLAYASNSLQLQPSDFFAKIGMANTASIRLFEKLGFRKGKVSHVFQEVEMEWDRGDATAWGWSGELNILDDPEVQEKE